MSTSYNLPTGEAVEIQDALSEYQMNRIRSCDHEWVVYSTALAEVWLMLQCVHCWAHGSVNDPSKEEWGEAFYAPERPYAWLDKSRVTIRGFAPPQVYKARNTPPLDQSAEQTD